MVWLNHGDEYMIKLKNGIVEIHEKFASTGVKTMDSQSRIALGEKIKKIFTKRADSFEVLVGEQGDVLLRPLASIPSKERWVHQNPKVLKQILQGLKELKDGKLRKIIHLDKFLKDL